jgi:hypothetical protein
MANFSFVLQIKNELCSKQKAGNVNFYVRSRVSGVSCSQQKLAELLTEVPAKVSGSLQINDSELAKIQN